MKTIKITIDLTQLTLGDEDKNKTPQEIVSTILEGVMLGYANQQRGFSEEDRRNFYKVSDALDAARKENKESIEVDDKYFEFVKKCFKETKLIPNKLIRLVEDLLVETK